MDTLMESKARPLQGRQQIQSGIKPKLLSLLFLFNESYLGLTVFKYFEKPSLNLSYERVNQPFKMSSQMIHHLN